MPESSDVSRWRYIRMAMAIALGVAGASALVAVSAVTAQTTHTYHLPVILLGRPIAFGSERDGNFYLDLYLMDADGTNVIKVPGPRAVYCPSWSPQGDRLVFTDRLKSDLFLINPNGDNLARVTNDARNEGYASWSPVGDQIVFDGIALGVSGLFVINPDGTGERALITGTVANYWHPTWSPDGKQIAFASNRDGNGEIYKASIGPNGYFDLSTVKRLTDYYEWDGGPSWSPKGDMIAYYSFRNGNYEIYSMHTDGTGLKQLTNNQLDDVEISWSPDGEQILFTSWRDGDAEIYRMNADGTGQTRLTDSPGLDRCASWRP